MSTRSLARKTVFMIISAIITAAVITILLLFLLNSLLTL